MSALELRQATSAQIILGPFVSNSDAITAITSLDVNSVTCTVFQAADVRSVAVSSAGGAENAFAHQRDGNFGLWLNDTDVGSLGRLRVSLSDETTFVPVFEECIVVPGTYYDDKYGTGVFEATVGSFTAAALAQVNSEVELGLEDYGAPNSAQIATLPNSGELNDHVLTLPTSAGLAARTVDAASYFDSTADSVIVGSIQTAPIQAIADKVLPKKNTAFTVPFYLANTSDHVTAVTSQADITSAQISLDAAAFVSGVGSFTEVGNGNYVYHAQAADMNGDFVVLLFSPNSADATIAWTRTGG